jgi:hypothetical protein
MPSPRTRYSAGISGSVLRHPKNKDVAMGRIVLAGVVFGLCMSLAGSASAQIIDGMCMMRCLDHGHIGRYCQNMCTKGVPASPPPRANRPTAPSNLSPAEPAPQAPAPVTASPAGAAPSVPLPVAQQPAAAQPTPTPQPAARSAPPATANQAPPHPAQTVPQQIVKPPGPPPRLIDEMCMMRCLDHGQLGRTCQARCTIK